MNRNAISLRFLQLLLGAFGESLEPLTPDERVTCVDLAEDEIDDALAEGWEDEDD